MKQRQLSKEGKEVYKRQQSLKKNELSFDDVISFEESDW
jgi:hypothetical protein